MTARLNLNPFWVSLFLMDNLTWGYLKDYFSIHKEDYFRCPVLVFYVILQFTAKGSFIKEQQTNFEYLRLL